VEYVWIRMGDTGEYEKFDSPYDAGEDVGSRLREVENFKFMGMGIRIYPGYSGRNYISLFWGDEEAQPTRDLSDEERSEFLQGLRKGFEDAWGKEAMERGGVLWQKGVAPPPEPTGTWIWLLLGGIVLFFIWRRRKT